VRLVSGVESADQQDGPQRRRWHGTDDAGELYRPVPAKTVRSQKLRMLLTHRKLLQSKAIAIETDPRRTLRNFGLKVGIAVAMKFEARIKELVNDPLAAAHLLDF
jgi:transposase